jgi:hypothetical protein
VGARYVCCDEQRRARLAAPEADPGVSGIDYVEVRPGATVADPTEIDIVLVKPLPLPAAALTGADIRLTGGVRFPAPTVAPDVVELSGGGSVATYRVTIPGGQQTDFSTYRLAIVSGAGTTPAFLDPRLSAVDLSFKVDCAEGDCAPDCRTVPGPPPPEPVFDYRAREWDGFRGLMLDRLAMLVPGFRSDDPVDLTTTLVEALAYRADQQSYRLDWVGTEAFLDTARSRTSLARHARLVDYRPGEGASARTCVALTFTADPAGGFPDGFALPAHTPVLPRTAGLPTVVPAAHYATLLSAVPVVFTTLAACPLWTWRSEIAVHTWADEECVLPRGATGVTLVDGSVAGAGALAAGDLLLLAEVASPHTGEAADADPAHRHVVRLTRVGPVTDVLVPGPLVDVEWDAADALPFDLVVSALVDQAAGPPRRVSCASAQGNVVLAEHGTELPPPPHLALPPATTTALTPRLDPPAPVAGVRWRPRLTGGPSTGPLGPPARVAAHGPDDVPLLPARQLVAVDPATCLPAVTLQDAFATWTVRADLLASGRFAREFVVESDAPGSSTLRFGDDTHGQAPAIGAAVGVGGRFGTGAAGNLGHGALGHVVLPDVAAGGSVTAAIGTVTNPLAAVGGAEPESLAAIRVAAPQAYRVQERAVTAADYATAALGFPGVANAVAVARWTGSWQTVVILVDRTGGAAVDAPFRTGLLTHLERYRLAGFDVAVRAAVAAPLDVALSVCAAPERLRSVVARQVREALSPFGAGGVPGFFHPDRFTFSTPLYLSALIAAVMAVPGVQSVVPTAFQRFGRAPHNEIALGVIRPATTEVLQLADDPDFPERGRLRIAMGGGR